MPGYTLGPYTSNRGITDNANQLYANNVAYYQQTPGIGGNGNVGGGRQVAQNNNSSGGGGTDWGSLFGGLFGTQGAQPQQMVIDPRNLAGRDKLEYKRQMAQGNSPFRSRLGGGAPANPNYYANYGGQGSAAPPPATTDPQTQIGGGGGGVQVDSGIKSGQLSDAKIQAGLQQLLAGGKKGMGIPGNMSQNPNGQGVTGGLFGDLMAERTMRNTTDYGRAASQQQADMQHAFEVARANGGLQQMQLASDTNRENVTHGVIQRNNMLDLLGQLLRGFGGI